MEDSYDEVKPTETKNKIVKETKTESYFDGKFLEYIGYKLLAGIITILSFSIAKPWADKLILDYKINHTIYNGKRLKFEGKGSSLFVQRFKWFLLSIITLGIYALWIPIKMEKWTTSNIHFEDEEFKNGESFFDGGLLGLIGVNLFTYLLTLISFGLLFPFAICYKQKWIAKHTVINCKKIVFNGKALSLIGNYLLWYLLSIITLGIYGIWLPMKVYGWNVKNTHIKLKDEEYEKESKLPIIIGIILLIIFVIGIIICLPKLNLTSSFEEIKQGNLIENIFNKNSNSGEASNGSSSSGTIKPNDNGNSSGTIAPSKKEAITVKWDCNCSNSSTKTYNLGDVITYLETPKRDGYEFVRWETENGTIVEKGYVITKQVKIIAIWKKVSVTEETPKSKCDDGWVYQYNECYKIDGGVDAINLSGGEGDDVWNGIGCPDGYKPAGYENGFEGDCHLTKEPNY